MFAADTNLEVGVGGTTLFNAHADELAYAFLVKHFEGIGLDEAISL